MRLYTTDEVNEWVRVMVFNATFNNMLAISWRSVLLVEETGGPGEIHQPVHTLYRNQYIQLPIWSRLQISTLIGTHNVNEWLSGKLRSHFYY
jgi:hypothetical protein